MCLPWTVTCWHRQLNRSFSRAEVLPPADHEKTADVEVSAPEFLLEIRVVPLGVHLVEPVEDLAEAMLETRRPLRRGPGLLHEDAIRRGVLELDEDVRPPRPVPGHQVAGEVAEHVVLVREAVVMNDPSVVHPEVCGQVQPRLEEGEDLVPLLQAGVRAKERLELASLLEALIVAEGKRGEHHCFAPSTGWSDSSRADGRTMSTISTLLSEARVTITPKSSPARTTKVLGTPSRGSASPAGH